MLRKLVREEIDKSPKERRLLVSALLLGGNVLVEQGSDRGGDFEHIPICTGDAQPGCVVAYSTFMGDPPPDAAFGRPPEGTDFLTGQPVEPDVEVACVNPGSIAANAETPAKSLVPTEPFPAGLISIGIMQLYGGLPPSAPTTWVQPQDHYSGHCERVNGAHVLRIQPVDGARQLNASARPDLGPSSRRRQRGARQPPGRRRSADGGVPRSAEAKVEAEGAMRRRVRQGPGGGGRPQAGSQGGLPPAGSEARDRRRRAVFGEGEHAGARDEPRQARSQGEARRRSHREAPQGPPRLPALELSPLRRAQRG